MKKLILPMLLLVLLCYTFICNDYYNFTEGLGNSAVIELVETEE